MKEKFKNHEILLGKDICTVVAIKHNPTGKKASMILGKLNDLTYGEGKALKDYYWSVYSFIKQNKNAFGWKNFKYDEFTISIAENTPVNYEKTRAWVKDMTLEEYKAWQKEQEDEEWI